MEESFEKAMKSYLGGEPLRYHKIAKKCIITKWTKIITKWDRF